MIKLWLRLAVALLVFAAPANAALVYKSTPDFANAEGYSYCSQCSGIPDFRIGSAFKLSSVTRLASVTFAVSNVSAWPTPVTVGIFQNLGKTVGAEVFRATYGSSAFNSNIDLGNGTSVVNVSFPKITIGSGDYFIFFWNPVDLHIPVFTVGDGNAVGVGSDTLHPIGNMVGDQVIRPGSTVGFALYSRDAALAVDPLAVGAIPEPASWALLIGGISLTGLVARHRPRKTEGVARG